MMCEYKKTIIYFLGGIIFSLPVISQNSQICGKTYYYKQILKVSNGEKFQGDFSGQFIYFNDKGCYDADREGFTVNNGFLEYKSDALGYQTYEGNSFWGKAVYYFLSDYSRLNIKIESNNTVYVYERAVQPQGKLTSSKIKANTEKNYNVRTLPIMPIVPSSGSNNSSSDSQYNEYLKNQTDNRVNQIKKNNKDNYDMFMRLYDKEKAEADLYYREYTIHGNTSDLQHSKDCEARATDYLQKANIWK